MLLNQLLFIALLIAASALFSLSEISLAASRKIKLRLLADAGQNAGRLGVKLLQPCDCGGGIRKKLRFGGVGRQDRQGFVVHCGIFQNLIGHLRPKSGASQGKS